MNNNNEKNIKTSFGYSNIIPSSQYISVLVQYCEKINNQYTQIIQDDEAKNEKLKYEFQSYQYGKKYSRGLEISIYDKKYKSFICKNLQEFLNAIQNNQVSNIRKLNITLEINFKRGQQPNIEEHENEFEIEFQPYEITFTRKSNFDDRNMQQIETDINELLKKFPAIDTIFCTKG